MEKKTININPELLKIKKTRKNKPNINPKLIKRKLMKRIKEHDKIPKTEGSSFQESENFLSNILNKKEKTLKNPQPTTTYTELSPINKNVENILFKSPNTNPLKLNYKIDDEKPHGCLKNGIKPCYRSYKNFPQPIKHISIDPTPQTEENIAKRIIESEINKAINGKTDVSTELIKKYYEPTTLNILEDVSVKPDVLPDNLETTEIELPFETLTAEPNLNQPNLNQEPEMEILESELENEISEPIQIKRTIKRKYTLGRKNNKIGVLIKNKKSKKNVIEYSKELKKISGEEIKKFLRENGLIKVGSTAPPEIVRKIFENTKMAGEIVNENKDILLNNLINEK
jgi:hypothetical protein